MASKKLTKICEICGDSYEGIAIQKYCPECKKNPDKAKKQYANAQRILKQHMGVYDEIKTLVCKNCNNEFTSYYGTTKFCSKNCKREYRIKTATCTQCGVNLMSLGIKRYSASGNVHFCSDKCKEIWRKETRLRKYGPIIKRTCPYCKQEFEDKNTTFCSYACYNKARQAGWKPDIETETDVICGICHKTYMTSLKHPKEYCPDCTEKINKIRREKDKIAIAKEAAIQKEKAAKKREADIEKNGLCFYCQTSYTQCEKMKSNFIYYPKGAKLLQGKVVECPAYTNRKKG